jgi:MFS family permease
LPFRQFLSSLAALAVAGFGGMSLVASCNTVLQTILDEDKRGRVMSFFTMAFIGMAPFGSLGAGSMAGILGPRNTLLLGSAGCLIGAAIFARHLPRIREKVRPIYLRMGIIQEVAMGRPRGTAAIGGERRAEKWWGLKTLNNSALVRKATAPPFILRISLNSPKFPQKNHGFRSATRLFFRLMRMSSSRQNDDGRCSIIPA